MLQGDDIIAGLVALDARVVGQFETNEAIVAFEHQDWTVDDRQEEALFLSRGINDRIQTAIHASCHVAAVGGAESYATIIQPVNVKEPSW